MSDETTIYPSPVVIPVVNTPFPGDGGSNAYFINIGTPKGPHKVQLDTGSTGIVIPADLIDGAPGVICLGPAQITYFPSKDTLTGCYYFVPSLGLGQVSGNGLEAQYACKTGPLIVFGAKSIVTAGKPTPVGAGMGMMGIGFGRPVLGYVANKGQSDAIAYRISNPFFYAQTNQGEALYPSYWLSSQNGSGAAYITLGSQAGTGSGNFQGQLTPLGQQPWPDPLNVDPANCDCTPPSQWPLAPALLPYWTTMPAQITVGSLNGGEAMIGTLLLDTGVDVMMMSIPDADLPNWPLQLLNVPGPYKVSLAVPDTTSPIMTYSFEINGPSVSFGVNSQTPSLGAPSQLLAVGGIQAVSPTPPTPAAPITGVFVNTGINPIRLYDYYVDAMVGQVGFNPVPA